jgi:hypothetical protein|tara:strand:+ start:2265 stop:2714 length:450 start_codon:yes stop_codon:yes gene_type:complete
MTRRAFAQEDADLSVNKVATSRLRKYKDIDLTLAVKTTTGDVYKKIDAAAVKQSVKNLIMTNRLEKPFNPSFGADIRGLLFELVDYTDGFMLKERIIQSIRQYEPRAEITDISVKGNDVYKNTVNATVTFRIISTAEVVQFSTNLVRLR